MGRARPGQIGRLKKVHELIDAAEPSQETLTQVSQAIMDAFREHQGHRGQYMLAPKIVRDRSWSTCSRGSARRAIERFDQLWSQSVLRGIPSALGGGLGGVWEEAWAAEVGMAALVGAAGDARVFMTRTWQLGAVGYRVSATAKRAATVVHRSGVFESCGP